MPETFKELNCGPHSCKGVDESLFMPKILAFPKETRGLKTPYIVVLVTTANKKEAEKIVTSLVEAKLIACGNIVNQVTSLFWWSGQVQKSEECLVLMKSRRDLFEKISEGVKELHSYKVPEIIAIEITDGSKGYLDWLESCLLNPEQKS